MSKKRKRMDFPEYHTLEQALILIERVTQYRQNLLSDYGFSACLVEGLVAVECEHRLRSLYEIKNSLLDLLPNRHKVDLKRFDEMSAERAQLREEMRKKKDAQA
jgi:hypothetical protein